MEGIERGEGGKELGDVCVQKHNESLIHTEVLKHTNDNDPAHFHTTTHENK